MLRPLANLRRWTAFVILVFARRLLARLLLAIASCSLRCHLTLRCGVPRFDDGVLALNLSSSMSLVKRQERS